MTSNKNNSPKILILGDLMLDEYFWGTCNRISPEAPVPIVAVNSTSQYLGGAGNVIRNVLSLETEVGYLGVIGNCSNSLIVKNLLSKLITKNLYLFEEYNRSLPKKSRIMAGSYQTTRLDFECIKDINSDSQNYIINTFEKIVNNFDLILVSDYLKGSISRKIMSTIIKIAKINNKLVFVDPKGNDYSKYKGSYLITPNRNEAEKITGINIDNDEKLESALKTLRNSYNINIALITLSENGMAFFDKEMRKISATAKEVYDVTGAGDTVLATIGVYYINGYNITDAIYRANIAAGIVVGRIGVSVTTIQEIENNLVEKTRYNNTKQYFKSIDENYLNLIKKNPQNKIVFTNGCFDILHSGHINYLFEAKSLGDILVVGLNSDKSIKRIKGQDRPILNEKERATILTALEMVDIVIIFDEDTPYNLIKKIRPHLLVKGGDYTPKQIVGHDLVKETKIVKFYPGHSSTKIIEKIKKV